MRRQQSIIGSALDTFTRLGGPQNLNTQIQLRAKAAQEEKDRQAFASFLTSSPGSPFFQDGQNAATAAPQAPIQSADLAAGLGGSQVAPGIGASLTPAAQLGTSVQPTDTVTLQGLQQQAEDTARRQQFERANFIVGAAMFGKEDLAKELLNSGALAPQGSAAKGITQANQAASAALKTLDTTKDPEKAIAQLNAAKKLVGPEAAALLNNVVDPSNLDATLRSFVGATSGEEFAKLSRETAADRATTSFETDEAIRKDNAVTENDLRAAQIAAGSSAPGITDPSPKDFTADSLDVFSRTGRFSDLVRVRSGSEKRAQESIDLGVDAARGIPTVRRSIELLDEVKTSGVRATALRAKQFFGVEGADEAELSANLGKAVLSQLRATFGAQFTEKEGARLERIEAGFGRSVAGNRRLLGQLKTVLDQRVATARRRAEALDDQDTLEELDEILSTDLTPIEQQQEAAPDTGGVPSINTQAEFDALPSGTRYVDAQTGRAATKP